MYRNYRESSFVWVFIIKSFSCFFVSLPFIRINLVVTVVAFALWLDLRTASETKGRLIDTGRDQSGRFVGYRKDVVIVTL